MNTLQRRQIAKGRVIDLCVAKTAIQRSQRQKTETVKSLRAAMQAKYFASKVDTVSYPQHGAE